MAKGLRTILVAVILSGLFAIALLNAGQSLFEANDVNRTLASDPQLNNYISNLNNTLSTSLQNNNDVETAIGETPPTLSTTGLIFESVGNVWKTLKTVPVTIYNLTIGLLFTKLLGSNQFAIAVVIVEALFVMALLFFVVKWAFTGEGG